MDNIKRKFIEENKNIIVAEPSGYIYTDLLDEYGLTNTALDLIRVKK